MSLSSDESAYDRDVEEIPSGSIDLSLSGDRSISEENVRNEKFTQNETKHVFRLRVLVIAVIILAAVAVSLVVFFLSKNGEEEEYEMQFEGTAEKVMEVFQAIVTEKFNALAGLSIAMTAHSMNTHRDW